MRTSDPPVKLLMLAIVGLWAYGWMPNLILMAQTGRVFSASPSTKSSSTFLSHSAAAALIGVTVLALFSAIFAATTRRPAVNLWYPITLIAPWFLTFIGYRTFAEDGFISGGGGFTYREIVYPLLVVAVYRVGPGVPEICRLIARLATISALLALVMAFTAQSIAFMPSWWNDEKSIFGNSILAGPYAHSNQIGTALSLALPFIYMSYTGWRRTLYVALTITTVLWSASRTSLLAIFGVSVLFLVTMAARSAATRLRLLRMGIFLLLLGAVALPILTANPLAYSGRGAIWQQSLYYWSLSPGIGWGPDLLREENDLTQTVGGLPIHSHNIWLTFAVTGGILLLVLAAVGFGLIFQRASQMYLKGEVGPLLFVAMLCALGIAEDPVRALHISPMSYVSLGGLTLVMCGLRDTASIARHSGRLSRGTLDARGSITSVQVGSTVL